MMRSNTRTIIGIYWLHVGKNNLTMHLSRDIIVVEKWTEPIIARRDVKANGIVNESDMTFLINYILTEAW